MLTFVVGVAIYGITVGGVTRDHVNMEGNGLVYNIEQIGGEMILVFRFYNAIRLGWWVFYWMFYEGSPDSVYSLRSINHYGIETATVFIGRGREAWRISHLAIQAWRPDVSKHKLYWRIDETTCFNVLRQWQF